MNHNPVKSLEQLPNGSYFAWILLHEEKANFSSCISCIYQKLDANNIINISMDIFLKRETFVFFDECALLELDTEELKEPIATHIYINREYPSAFGIRIPCPSKTLVKA